MKIDAVSKSVPGVELIRNAYHKAEISSLTE